MKEYQYMIQTSDGEMHLIDARNDAEAKSKLAIFLGPPFTEEGMEIFDKYDTGEWGD